MILMNPDCLDGKHRACSGDGWCEEADHAVPCPCSCNQPKECYPGCPHPPCVAIRAAQPVAAAIQAKHLSGASIGKLVEWDLGRSAVTSEIQWSPLATLAYLSHSQSWVNLGLNIGHDDRQEMELEPNDWVRITAVAGQDTA